MAGMDLAEQFVARAVVAFSRLTRFRLRPLRIDVQQDQAYHAQADGRPGHPAAIEPVNAKGAVSGVTRWGRANDNRGDQPRDAQDQQDHDNEQHRSPLPRQGRPEAESTAQLRRIMDDSQKTILAMTSATAAGLSEPSSSTVCRTVRSTVVSLTLVASASSDFNRMRLPTGTGARNRTLLSP